MNSEFELVNFHLTITVFYLVNVLCRAVAFGLATLIFLQAFRLLSALTGKPWARKVLSILLAFQIVLLAVDLSLVFAAYILQLNSWHFSGSTLPLWYPEPSIVTILFAVADGVTFLRSLVTTALTVWRASCLYPDRLVIRFSLISSGVLLMLYTMPHIGIQTYYKVTEESTKHITIGLEAAQHFLSVGVTLLATSWIYRIAWYHQQSTKHLNRSQPSEVAFTLCSLIDTGFILCVTQLIVAVLSVAHYDGNPVEAGHLAYSVILVVLDTFITVHPALLVLVLFKSPSTPYHSNVSSPVSGEGRKTHLSTLRFAQTNSWEESLSTRPGDDAIDISSRTV